VRWCVVLLVACGHPDPTPAPAPIVAAKWSCEAQPFALSTPIPEASGAAWTEFRGKPALFVISDSGNNGAYGIIDPDSGDTLAQGKLEDGGHGDDYEGVAARGGKIWAIVSSGYAGAITREGDSFHLGTLAPVGGEDMVCKHKTGNCGRNFEGICLDDRPGKHAGCAGFAASKADGKLYCLHEQNGTYVADPDHAIDVTAPKHLADCAIGEDGTLWAGANILGGNLLYRIESWEDPARARITEIGPVGIGNAEVVAVRGDSVYRLSDTDGAPSLMAKFRCSPATR